MAEPTLEERVAALEREVAALKVQSPSPAGGRWWELLPPLTPEQRQAHEEAAAYGRYFRKTGREAPPDWKPGDPIPEADGDAA